jgi:hypothetical protein
METPVFSSNAVRLSIREWGLVLVVLAAAALFSGGVWRRVEPFTPGADYRLPYELAEDYWLFGRFCAGAAADRTLVLGDSVIWGQYVAADRTLTHFLNEPAGAPRFVNAGLDGAHPIALGGLVEHHCGTLGGRRVVVHLNLLWLGSLEADLEAARDTRLNHARLLPQFAGRPPAYQATLSDRIGVVISRHVPALDWARHVQVAYYDGLDLAGWSIGHPYANPAAAIARGLPHPSADAIRRGEPWTARRAALQDLPWMPLDRSRQWRAFQQLVDRLRNRGAPVTVVVGPLNEHMLVAGDVAVHRRLAAGAVAWLRARGVATFVPETLPSDLYADLSHPLADGYALLAERLWAAGLR